MTIATRTYQVIEGWEKLPKIYAHGDVCGVAVDSRDRVFIITRHDQHVLVYESDGAFITRWEGTSFVRTHGITIGPDDSVYLVDDRGQTVSKYTPDGTLLFTIGVRGQRSETGYDGHKLATVVRGAPPFNEPTNLAVAPNGDLYVSDGYGNARVHRFTAGGELIQSWGEPGTGPGQFNLPHGIGVAPDERVFVADRENDRIQIFDPEGAYLDQWTDIQRPTNIRFDREGTAYVAELWRPVGQNSFMHGPSTVDQPGRVSIFDPDGTLLVRWGGADRTAPGDVIAPHDVCVDSKGALYVAEVTYTFAGRQGMVPLHSHDLQKFVRDDR